MSKMENYQGDLTDIVRASSQAGNGGTAGSSSKDQLKYNIIADWQFPSSNIPLNFSSSLGEEPNNNFGDPFSNTKDPLLNELEMPVSGFFINSSEMVNSIDHVNDSTGQGLSITDRYRVANLLPPESDTVGDGSDIMKKPCNIFSKMLQISPSTTLPTASSTSCDSPTTPTGIKSPVMAPNDMINVNSSKACLVDNTGLQISFPRNPGVKRRKSQAKKVVCIPAPAPVNSRPGGEVVPSDLWAWRKYGQKPIKGSPYPRGYYRCSSSKGCSARKQVERSRTDPNMLVITYTSEHNHPWPTQRNALAGSTRTSQPTKCSNASSMSSTCTTQLNQKITTSPKQEQRDYNNNACPIFTAGAGGSVSTSVKEEIEGVEKQALEFVDDGELIISSSETAPFPYRPPMLDQSNQSHDQQELFAELGEIETDPLNLLFTQNFPTDDDQQKGNNSKALEPFINIFDDWLGDNNTTSYDEGTNNKALL